MSTRSAGRRWRAALPALLVALTTGPTACDDDKPPAPPARAQDPAAPGAAEAEAFYEPGAMAAVLTYAGERGRFADTSKLETVPEPARGLVRVKLLGGEAAPPGTVWVANLKTAEDDGRYRLRTVPRDLFEELALDGRKSDVTLPEGLELPEKVAAADGVIVYKTAWCGVCKKVEGYLKRKGVAYEAKDIEKSREAAAELQVKAKEQGVRTGSVPIIDVGGTLIVGFDRKRLEALL